MADYKYTFRERSLNTFIRFLMHLLANIDTDELKKIPTEGPLILFTNHVNFMEGTVIYTEIQKIKPRYLTGFAKIEFWDSPIMGYVFDTWDAVKLHRGEADLSAIKEAVARIKEGQIFGMAPEGTRSRSGLLHRAHPGISMLAYMSEAPIIPVACYGHKDYKNDWKHLRRTNFKVRIGETFRLDAGGRRVNNQVRQQMADEMMYILAALLPESYRGEYADLSQATTEFIVSC